MNFLRFSLAAVLGAAISFAQSADPVQPGRKLFVQACGFCHGDDATGARGPDLIRSPLANRDKNGDLLGPVIRNGRVDKGMPAFAYSNAQISEISAFLHNRIKTAMASSSVPRDYPLEKLLTGNAEAGKRYFSAHCVQCHSATGDLAGIAKRFTPINLEARFLYPSGKLSTATVTLPSGEKISGTLAHIDEFDIALRDSSGWYQSWPRDRVKVEVHDPLEQHRTLLHEYSDADVHNVFAYLETLK